MIDISKFASYQPIENLFGRQDRFSYAIVSYEGQKMFLKLSLQPAGAGDIRRELVWADFMSFVEANFPAAKLRSPHNYQLIDDSSLLMEYIEAPVVARPGDGSAWKMQIDNYIDMLVALDEAAESYRIPARLKIYQTRSVEAALMHWLRKVPITPEIKLAIDYVMQRQNNLTYRLQHGDLTPWQVFDLGESWAIFDGERAGGDLPRFNDLAYGYGRLAIRCGEPEAADYMITEFIKRRAIDERQFWQQFRPVLAFRLLSMIGDATRDQLIDELAKTQDILDDLLNTDD